MTETFERSGLVTSQPEKSKQSREHDSRRKVSDNSFRDSRNRRSESENSGSKKMSDRSDGLP